MEDARRRAFERALDHWREVFTFANQLAGDRGRAEDVAQEAYLRLWAIDRPPDDPRPVRALLFTIVRNLVRGEARRHGARPLDLGLLDELEGIDDASDTALPDVEASRGETCAGVRAALGTLRPSWRAALYLADGLDLSYGEIARCLDTSEDVVRTTLHRARDRMRRLLRRTAAENYEP